MTSATKNDKSPVKSTRSKSKSYLKAAAKVAAKPVSLDGYKQNPNGKVLVPVSSNIKLPKPGKIAQSIESAKEDIQRMIESIADFEFEQFDTKEIEFSLSFGVQGGFLGVGVNGNTSVKIKVTPKTPV